MEQHGRLVLVVAITAALSAASNVRAGGFGILVQSTSAIGNAVAGGAAAAEDATTIWYNPAGMGKLSGLVASTVVSAVQPSFKFHNTGSSGAFALPGTGEGGDGGSIGLVPQGYVAVELGERWRVGVGLNTPFGLKTEYDDGWRGALTALKSEAVSYNVNPSIAYRLGPSVWIGAGVSIQHFSAELTNFGGPLGTAKLKASDTSWGFNAGALFDVTPDTRVGAAFRSKISYSLSGDATFAGGAAFNSGAQADLTVPEAASINIVTKLSPHWELMGGATWTRWSRLQTLTVTRTSASALGLAGSVVTTLPFNWRNSTLMAAGANYKPNDNWKIRFGIAHDPAVSNDLTRTARLPDQRRILIALGAQFQQEKTGPFKNWTFDFSIGHEFVKDANVNNAVTGVPGRLVGTFENEARVVSFQASYRH